VLAKAGRGWLHVGQLWVHTGLRGRGYGRQLMEAAEAEGRRLGCHSAYLDTFSFQARPFYEGCGYEVFGVLDRFPDEHQRFFMRKGL
jgi:GNAT superfamily N-acetyltransferase